MSSYGQFCAIARTLEVLGERWTLLIVRELLCGARAFGDIRRGVPRISKTMLAARLRTLVDAGVVARDDVGYALTAAGQELAPIVMGLGTWGQRWLPRTLTAEQLDVDALLWDVQRRARLDALPAAPLVVRFELADLRGPAARRFLLLRRGEASLCAANAGFPERIAVRTPRAPLVAWWRGDITFAAAQRAGLRVDELDGGRGLARQFPGWFARYALADVAPA